MNHEVCNIFYKLLPIFNEIDLSKLDKILVQSLSLIQRHWLELKNMFTYSKDLQLTNICQSSTEEVFNIFIIFLTINFTIFIQIYFFSNFPFFISIFTFIKYLLASRQM